MFQSYILWAKSQIGEWVVSAWVKACWQMLAKNKHAYIYIHYQWWYNLLSTLQKRSQGFWQPAKKCKSQIMLKVKSGNLVLHTAFIRTQTRNHTNCQLYLRAKNATAKHLAAEHTCCDLFPKGSQKVPETPRLLQFVVPVKPPWFSVVEG